MSQSLCVLSVAAASVAFAGSALGRAIELGPSSVSWSHIQLPDLNDHSQIIGALPTSGEVRYDNITTWRRGLAPSFPESLWYQMPGNKPEIWTSDDLHLGSSDHRFNQVHFVVHSYEDNRPFSLAFWGSDAELGWSDPETPDYEFSFELPEMSPGDNYDTLVTVTLPMDIDLGGHLWMGIQSILDGGLNELIARSSPTAAFGSSEDWWSQVPGEQTQYPSPFFFTDVPNNYAYALSYAVPAPSAGLAAGVFGLTMVHRRRRDG